MKTRRILSALLAAAMTCAMCLSVGAADAPATSVDGYPINANGETYGSYLDRHKYGYAPDLIAALGDDGTEGYIRREDFAPELGGSLEELRQYQAHVDANPAIPLYDLDGNVIGTFIRGTTQDNSTPDPDIVQKLNEMTGGRADEFLPSADPIPIRHDYPTNANGETYGSYLDILKYGYPPQLIRAIGDNNQTGYLRLADFRADNRPSNANAVWNIYDLNGTVIDTFGK